MKLKHGNDPDENFNLKQLKAGIEVEMEHTDDKDLAKQIAKAHLAEFQNYYIELKKMEDRMKSKESLFKEVEKMESEIKKNKNPIQRNPSNPRNPNYEIEGADNVPEDKEAGKLIAEIESLEREMKGVTETAKPYQAPVRKPQKSDNMESPDGIAIMNEIDQLGKAFDELKGNQQAPINPMPDGTGPHGKGMGPGQGKGDGSGSEECDENPFKRKEEGAEEGAEENDKPELDKPKLGSPVKVPIIKPAKPEDPKVESLSIKEYLAKSKVFRHQVPSRIKLAK